MGYGWHDHDHDHDHDHSDYDDDMYEHGRSDWWDRVMKPTSIALGLVAAVVIFFVLCWCCRRRKMRGVVIQPPPHTVVTVPGQPAPYPQQAYHSPAPQHQSYQAATPYPAVNATGYPNAGAPYPTAGAPYPTAGAPYPTAGAPYPNAGAPYPTGGAPYPAVPGADNAGFTVTAPPPSYNEAVGHEAYSKQSAYNPAYPHS